jgi:hypothetical protein
MAAPVSNVTVQGIGIRDAAKTFMEEWGAPSGGGTCRPPPRRRRAVAVCVACLPLCFVPLPRATLVLWLGLVLAADHRICNK